MCDTRRSTPSTNKPIRFLPRETRVAWRCKTTYGFTNVGNTNSCRSHSLWNLGNCGFQRCATFHTKQGAYSLLGMFKLNLFSSMNLDLDVPSYSYFPSQGVFNFSYVFSWSLLATLTRDIDPHNSTYEPSDFTPLSPEFSTQDHLPLGQHEAHEDCIIPQKVIPRRILQTNTRLSQYTPWQRWGSSWFWELAAMTLSCFSLVLTLAILHFFDGKPLESWALYLSLGTIISTLAQISRTSLAFAITPCFGQAKWNWFSQRGDDVLVFRTFDEASRGPLGSLQLLWKLKCR